MACLNDKPPALPWTSSQLLAPWKAAIISYFQEKRKQKIGEAEIEKTSMCIMCFQEEKETSAEHWEYNQTVLFHPHLLWGPLGFIPGYCKSWLMLLQHISPYFWKVLIVHRSSSWLKSGKSSWRVRRKTLVITGLSASLQCLVKLGRRLFCQSWDLTHQMPISNR